MIPTQEIALRLLVAALLGAIIGYNRGRLEWTAGLRTHMLVCVGAALAIIVSAFGFQDVLNVPHVVLDPSRIAAQVVSGVGFLGAGTILFLERERVIRGLTTAAGLWAVASIGLAAGSGLFAAAFITTALLWVILAVLKPIERRFLARRARVDTLRVAIGAGATLAAIESALRAFELPIRRLVLKREPEHDVVVVKCVTGVAVSKLAEVAEALRRVDGVREVEWSYARPAGGS
ncbi:MAG TPA: MgtC/SapB family protein [Dokdonella sp.]